MALFGGSPARGSFSDGAPVVGMQVVLREFAAAAAKRSGRFQYRLAELSHEAEAPRGTEGIPTIAVRSISEDPKGIAVWHDLGFDPARSFAIRRHAGGGYPVVLTHHSLSYKRLVQESYLPLLLQRPLPTDAIACSSVAARDALARILDHVASSFGEAFGVDLGYRGRLEVIPLGVDTARYRPLEQAACRERFQLPRDAFVLLWVGRLSAIDKADLLPLLRVLSSLKAANPGRRLLLVCAGSEYAGEAYSETLRSFASAWGLADDLRILLDLKEILPELYGCADVFVSPVDSLQESFGLAPVEAMACGIPQVVSDWNGYRDTVVDGVTGYLVPTLWASCVSDLVDRWFLHDDTREHAVLGQSVAVDAHALELRLQQLLDSPALREEMAGASRARAVERFDWAAVLSRHEALWDELILAHPEGPPPAGFEMRRLPYTDVFGHYATRVLDGSEELTLASREALEDGARVALPAKLKGIVEPEVLSRIVRRLARSVSGGETLTSGELVGELYRDCGLSPSAALRHLLWLVKHGWVAAGPPRAGTEGPEARNAGHGPGDLPSGT